MRVEEIIAGLNKYIESRRNTLKIKVKGHIVLHKTYISHPTFKAYKEYKYDVWYVNKPYSNKILSISKVEKVLEGHEEKILSSMNVDLCTALFELINSEDFELIIYGEYEGNKNE